MQYCHTTTTKEATYSDRRYLNWGPRKKVAVSVEGRKECNPEATIRHRIEQAVAGSCKKEKQPHRPGGHTCRAIPKPKRDDEQCQETSEQE